MEPRMQRLAENESVFRAVNELIETTATQTGVDDHVFEFLCECSDTSCTMLLPLTVFEYEQVRADPTQFLIAPEHERPELETVVARHDSYEIVRKFGEAADYVTQRDPRTI